MMTCGAGLEKWLPRVILLVIFFFIAVDIAPEVDDDVEEVVEDESPNDFSGRFLSPTVWQFMLHELPIDGSDSWQSCGSYMHRCKQYCCCDQGYTFDSTGCQLKVFKNEPPSRGHLLFCSAFDSEEKDNFERQKRTGTYRTPYSELQGFDEASLLQWVSTVMEGGKNAFGYALGDSEVNEALAALRNHHVDGKAFLKLTSSNLDAEWNLLNIGIPEGAARVLAHRALEVKPVKPSEPFRRLSTGTSGCDSDKSSGARGCDSDTSHRHHQAVSGGVKGCSKSSSGTRGCESSSATGATGARGCESSGAKGCHSHSVKGCHEHSAVRGCDSGVQGCHSGVCGCEETSQLGDMWGALIFLPFLMLIAIQAMFAPVVLVAALLLPALLLLTAFVTLPAGAGEVTAKVSKVKSVKGEAHIVYVRKQPRHGFNYEAELNFSMNLGEDKFSGTLSLPEIMDAFPCGELRVDAKWKGSGPSEAFLSLANEWLDRLRERAKSRASRKSTRRDLRGVFGVLFCTSKDSEIRKDEKRLL
eukprot:Skav215233  [mRNA]  locus=scaffold341:332678:339587:- [translate_table: standard]